MENTDACILSAAEASALTATYRAIFEVVSKGVGICCGRHEQHMQVRSRRVREQLAQKHEQEVRVSAPLVHLIHHHMRDIPEFVVAQ